MSGDPEVWCVLTLKDGELSLLKGLTADECRAVVQRVRGDDPWSQEAIYARVLAQHAAQNPNTLPGYAQAYHSAGWGVNRCEWWGSKGSQLEIWPKPADYDARLADAARVAGIVTSTNKAMEKAS